MENKSQWKIEWDQIPTDLTKEVAIGLLDSQVFSGSVQWVLLEISWKEAFYIFLGGKKFLTPWKFNVMASQPKPPLRV